MNKDTEKQIAVMVWAEDFYKALQGQPRLSRWLVYQAMGQFARFELQGMYEALVEAGQVMDVPYVPWSGSGEPKP